MRRAVILCTIVSLLFACTLCAELALAQGGRDDLWVTNAPVYATALSATGDTLYLGGDFKYVGPATGSWWESTRQRVSLRSHSQGQWNRIRRRGGWRGRLVHRWRFHCRARPTAQLSRPPRCHRRPNLLESQCRRRVNALAVSGDTVYAGGTFTSIGGQTRNRIAALNAMTGLAMSWNPNASSSVVALAVSGAQSTRAALSRASAARRAIVSPRSMRRPGWRRAGTECWRRCLYPCREWGHGLRGWCFRDHPQRIAQLHRRDRCDDRVADELAPMAGNYVYALAVSGSVVYAGGSFTSIGGQIRMYIARLMRRQGGRRAGTRRRATMSMLLA